MQLSKPPRFTTPSEAVSWALDQLGGPSRIARSLPKPLSPWAVSKWRYNCPAERAVWLVDQLRKRGWSISLHDIDPKRFPSGM